MRGPLIVFALSAIVASATIATAQDRYGAPPEPGYAAPGEPRGDRPYDDRRDGDRRDDRGPRPEAVFYTDDRFGGRTLTLDHGVRRMGEVGMEDNISSVRIVSGSWLVCSDDDFRGRCVTLDRSVARLNRIGMEDKISSVRPIRGGDRDRRDAY